jgi:hypothetical protein
MVSAGSGPAGDDPPADLPLGPEDGSEAPVGFIQGRGQVPPDAFRPYVAPPVTRRRRSDWPVLVFALVLATVIMAGVCIAGFAVYVKNGGAFH